MLKRSIGKIVALVWLLGLAVHASERLRPPTAVQPPAHEATAPAVRLAEFVLMTADRLYAAAIGSSGQASPQGIAWGVIARSQDAQRIFEELASFPSHIGIYGLIGLKWLEAPSYSTAATRFRRAGGTFEVMVGCIISIESVDELLDKIDGGEWVELMMLYRESASSLPISVPP